MVVDPKLVEDVVDVGFYRVRADGEQFRKTFKNANSTDLSAARKGSSAA